MPAPSAARRTLCGLLALALVSSGCSTAPAPPTSEVRSRLGRVAVVALHGTPEGDFHTFAKSQVEGAAKGALGGALQGLAYALGSGASSSGGGPYAAAAGTIAAIVFTVVGTGVGTVVGQQTAIPSATAQDIETRTREVLRGMDLVEGVASALRAQAEQRPETEGRGWIRAEAGPSYAALARERIDTVLELSVPATGFQGGRGRQPETAFYMAARVRVLTAPDRQELYARDFLYTSHARPLEAWLESGARELGRELERATQRLAERILDELFLVTGFPFPSGLWAPPGDPAFATCWFYPIYPAREIRGVWDFVLHPQSLDTQQDLLGYPVVESLQPTLEWEPLPRPRDRTPANQERVAQLREVRYDVKVWEANDGYPERLVIDRSGLEEPRLRPEAPLRPGTRYFWTFRARYTTLGQPQVTRWAFSLAPVNPPMPAGGSCDLDAIPNPNYFRFATGPAGP